jgi:predicted nucleotidyltransferase
MDVAKPITTAIPSLDGPVLAALASTTAPMDLALVHQRAGRGSKSGVRSVLLRMLAEGLVLTVPGGYVLNRDHLATPAIEQLAGLHGALIARIRSTIEQWTTVPRLVALFGSVARRDGDAFSDVDVLIVSDAVALDESTDELADRIRRWTGNDAQVIGRTTTEIKRMRKAKEPIVAQWERDLVVISGDRRVLESGL